MAGRRRQGVGFTLVANAAVWELPPCPDQRGGLLLHHQPRRAGHQMCVNQRCADTFHRRWGDRRIFQNSGVGTAIGGGAYSGFGARLLCGVCGVCEVVFPETSRTSWGNWRRLSRFSFFSVFKSLSCESSKREKALRKLRHALIPCKLSCGVGGGLRSRVHFATGWRTDSDTGGPPQRARNAPVMNSSHPTSFPLPLAALPKIIEISLRSPLQLGTYIQREQS